MAELNSSDLKHLISDYESQIRRLQFELDQTKLTVRTLKGSLSTTIEREKAEANAALQSIAEAQAAKEAAGAAKRGKRVGRPPKQLTASAVSESPDVNGKKAKKKSDKPRAYRLSEYDQYLYDCLNARGKATISSEFLTYIMEQKQAKGETANEDDVAIMIARSLQKLANRREDLIKVPYDGRGKAYALPSWMRGKKLISKYNRS